MPARRPPISSGQPDRLAVGYLHVGPPAHGVSRYGRLIAAEAKRRRDLRVIEHEVLLEGRQESDNRLLDDAARAFEAVNVVHLQYNNHSASSVWGEGWRQLWNLRRFAAASKAPIVATVHDVYPVPLGYAAILRHPVRQLRRRHGAPATTLRWMHRRTARLFVCSNEERSRMPNGGDRVVVIPHFVERRTLGDGAQAKRELGLIGARVVTLLGYIHGRKGHRLLIDAFQSLPNDLVLVFAGAPARGDEALVAELTAHAAACGVADRLRVTGYLSESDLNLYLAATDLAVCPFRTFSASGSLSTWISSCRQIVATDLPQIAEYNALANGAIRTFSPYTANALSAAVRRALDDGAVSSRSALTTLSTMLGLPAAVSRHVGAYRDALGLQADERSEAVS